MCTSLIEIGSKTAEKNSAQTNRQTDRHYENNGHLAVNQYRLLIDERGRSTRIDTDAMKGRAVRLHTGARRAATCTDIGSLRGPRSRRTAGPDHRRRRSTAP